MQKYYVQIGTPWACSSMDQMDDCLEVVYYACDVDAAIAARDAEIERCKRAVEWCLENGAKRATVLDISANEYVDGIRDAGCDCCSSTLEVPAEFADIISPAAGGDGK